MRLRILTACLLSLSFAGSVRAHGILIPEDKALPPLAMVNHRVNIAIDDQVAITKVEQTFRNHTERQLEATYIFPVPKGASVNKFTMWVDGKEQAGEMLPADKARDVYTSIVRRTQDPGLLEYIGNNMIRLRVFPVLPKVDQKVTLAFTSVAPNESGVVEYTYPLKTDGKATKTLEDFSVKATIKSQHPVQNVYSPTHALDIKRAGDKEVAVSFSRDQATLDKDFQLYYTLGNKEIGVTPLMYRPITGEDGYFMLLVSPQLEETKAKTIPRDMVFVLDTSGSMAGVKMDQAKKALNYCLDKLGTQDRFALVGFSTAVNRYRDTLVEASAERIAHAHKWVDALKPSGGTAIDDALKAALDLRSSDEGRTFTVVFFTDGQPTIGETKPEVIVKNVEKKNSGNTRLFTFGVGDDVNATMLDRIAEQTKALSSYVRPEEDITAKVGGLYGKISNPVLANLKMTVSDNVTLSEVYPTNLPDLFWGTQLVVIGRYTGQGAAAVKLAGTVGTEKREFAYDVTFPAKTDESKDFVEHLWARRKVGFLLDQVRINGEKQELLDEIVALSKKYGIATPYTSYLIVPDGVMPVVPSPGGVRPPAGPVAREVPDALRGKGDGKQAVKLADFAKDQATAPPMPTGVGSGGALPGAPPVAQNRFREEDRKLAEAKEAADKAGKPGDEVVKKLEDAQKARYAQELAAGYLRRRDQNAVQSGQLGVDLSVASNNLRAQERLTQTANRVAYGRNCLEVGGVWIDENLDAKMPMVAVKAQSDAYFRMLEKQPKLKEVFKLGNHVVWVTPNKTALVIDEADGKEKLTDEEIDALFAAGK